MVVEAGHYLLCCGSPEELGVGARVGGGCVGFRVSGLGEVCSGRSIGPGERGKALSFELTECCSDLKVSGSLSLG